jgi:hypothetical protein
VDYKKFAWQRLVFELDEALFQSIIKVSFSLNIRRLKRLNPLLEQPL